jgi:hypothetical protein
MYGKLPEVIGIFESKGKEFLWYQYLPIKLSGQNYYKIEERLWGSFSELIDSVIKHYIRNIGFDKYLSSYIYLTAKRQYQKNGCGFNRSGWHSDSFMSDDLNFLWTDKQPTVFNNSNFNISQDDELSLIEMEEQALPQNNITFPLNSILLLDQYCIHKVGEIEDGVRTFVKITFSDKKFDLEGNSVNYLLDYDWKMRPRNKQRNVPHL